MGAQRNGRSPRLTVKIQATKDKPGRTVVVAVELNQAEDPPGLVRLEVGGVIGQTEWTWLTHAEAREVAAALVDAASSAEAG